MVVFQNDIIYYSQQRQIKQTYGLCFRFHLGDNKDIRHINKQNKIIHFMKKLTQVLGEMHKAQYKHDSNHRRGSLYEGVDDTTDDDEEGHEYDLDDYKMTDKDGVGIYIGSYGEYNNGSLKGAWFDMSKFSDAEEFFDVCYDLMGEDAELMAEDYQNFPEQLYSESPTRKNIQAVIDWAKMDDDDREILTAFADARGTFDINKLSTAKDQLICVGEENYREAVLNIFYDMYEVSDGLKNYIDEDYVIKNFSYDTYEGTSEDGDVYYFWAH